MHLRGKMIARPASELRGVLERLSQHLEQRLLPKPIWKIGKVEERALAKMERMIVPISMDVSSIEGTWKLSQNKAEEVRLSAAEGNNEEWYWIADCRASGVYGKPALLDYSTGKSGALDYQWIRCIDWQFLFGCWLWICLGDLFLRRNWSAGEI